MEFFFVFYSLRLHGHTSTEEEEVHRGAWTAAGARFRPIGERGSIDGESRDEGEGTNSGKRLPAPNPAFGERKKLLNDLDRMPLQFAERIKDLLKKLDNILIESPQIEEQLRRLEVEVGKILDVMKPMLHIIFSKLGCKSYP